jgi:hypothetical protein
MAEAVKLYQEIGFPALQKGSHDKKLVGYFQADTGTINQILHLWKFDDDADRRGHWAALYANKDFIELVDLFPEAPCSTALNFLPIFCSLAQSRRLFPNSLGCGAHKAGRFGRAWFQRTN